jgi:phage tail sheath protein FI
VTHPMVSLQWREIGILTEHHINPILPQPSRGVVLWGARTLCVEPEWKHITARRIVSFIAEQLRRDNEWVMFESQKTELWEVLRRVVTTRLDSFWSAGLLTGGEAGTDYLVQCNAELNPPAVRDAGIVNIKVRLRPISTQEFIIVDLRLGS